MPRESRRRALPVAAVFCVLLVSLLPMHAAPHATIATFSIVAHDPATGELGVAVQSRFFAVGAVVPYAEGDVGAIASQAMGNPTFGPRGLRLLREGHSVQETLDLLLKDDPDRERRQVAIVDAKGRTAAYTGSKCSAWASHRTGPNFSVQGNILVSEQTVAAMEKAFTDTQGMLGEKLLRAIEEGQKAGGDARGMQSAAMLIVKQGAGYGGTDRYCDLRVDDHAEPIQELRRIFNLWKVRALTLEGYRLVGTKEYARAIAIGKEAVALDPTSGHSQYNLACFLSRAGRSQEALKMLQEALALDARLARRAAEDSDFEPLHADPAFKQLIAR